MSEMLTQVNIIQIAVDNLATKVKEPKDETQRTHFLSAIGEIKRSAQRLKELIGNQFPETRQDQR